MRGITPHCGQSFGSSPACPCRRRLRWLRRFGVVWEGVSREGCGRVPIVAHTRVLTTSNGYLRKRWSAMSGEAQGGQGLTSPESRHGSSSACWSGASRRGHYLGDSGNGTCYESIISGRVRRLSCFVRLDWREAYRQQRCTQRAEDEGPFLPTCWRCASNRSTARAGKMLLDGGRAELATGRKKK